MNPDFDWKPEGGGEESILMKTKTLNKLPEPHSILILNNSIDPLNEFVSRSLEQGRNTREIRTAKENRENSDPLP